MKEKIETKRLILQRDRLEDAEEMVNLINENLDYLKPFLPWAKFYPETAEYQRDLIQKSVGQFDAETDFVYTIFNKGNSKIIGKIGLHSRVGKGALEMGYWIAEPYANRGFATEAARAVINCAFQFPQIQRILIGHHRDNLASAKIPQKLHFQPFDVSELPEERKEIFKDHGSDIAQHFFHQMSRVDFAEASK